MKRMVLLFILILFCFGFSAGPSTGIRNIPDHNLADQGDSVGRSVKNIIDQVDPNRKMTLVLAHVGGYLDEDTIYYFNTSETIPSNITLEIEPGAIIGGSAILTINGPFKAGLTKCFGGSITVVFGKGSIEKLNILWWGADPNKANASATTNAIQSTIDCAISSWSSYTYDARDYALSIYAPKGNYLINDRLIIDECQGFSIFGDEGSFLNTTIQWDGNDITDPNYYMIDARSVLGFGLKNITLIGQADISDANSNCIENGIITGRYDSGIFNSYNAWTNVKIYRFPGTGIQFGRYEGYDDANSVYPTDVGQTDNSHFQNIYIQDCHIGMILNSPNFLQCQFDKLVIFSYGGNPVDANSVPIESGSAAPIKFRTQNAVQILYGELQGTDIDLIAPYCDPNIVYSQYAIYCLDGSFNILNGYCEARFLAYVDNGANDAGGNNVKNINSICNFHLYPGAAGGPLTSGKYPIYYAQQSRPLTLMGTRKIYVIESPDSAGVYALGCQVETTYVSVVDVTNKIRNTKSMDIACCYMTYDEGYRWSTNNFIGNWGNIVEDDGSILILKNLIRRNYSDGTKYLFYAADPNTDNTTACGVIIDPNDSSLKWFKRTNMTDGAPYARSSLESYSATLKWDNYFYDTIGTDAYAFNPTPPYTAYERGMDFLFFANDENIGACTLNINGLGAKPIKRAINRDLFDSYILDGSMVHVMYDGTNFQILSEPAEPRLWYPSYNAVDHGLTGNNDTLKYMNDSIHASNGPGTIILKCVPGDLNTAYIINTNETIESDVTLKIEPGAYIDGNATLTINGSFIGSPDCFDSDFDVDFGSKAIGENFQYGIDAESSDDYVITIGFPYNEYIEGMKFSFKANTANTGACTANLNSWGAKSIKILHDQDPGDNCIEANMIVNLEYDGTYLQMTNPCAN